MNTLYYTKLSYGPHVMIGKQRENQLSLWNNLHAVEDEVDRVARSRTIINADNA